MPSSGHVGGPLLLATTADPICERMTWLPQKCGIAMANFCFIPSLGQFNYRCICNSVRLLHRTDKMGPD